MILSVSNLSKSFIHKKILDEISFNIDKGDKIGLIGINGAGKSTLFQILNNDMSYDHGNIYKIRNIKIGYLRQNTIIDWNNDLWGLCKEVFSEILAVKKELREMEEQMGDLEGKALDQLLIKYHERLEYFEENSGYSYESEIRGTLKGLGFQEEQFHQSIETFSGGEKSRIALAQLILQKPDLLLLDEPTNHLDLKGIEFLESFVRDFKNAAIIISHDRYFLDRCVNRIFHLENHRMKCYETDYTGFQKQRKKYLDIMKKTYENQQKEIKRQEEIIDRYLNYGNERLIKQGRSRKKLLEKMKLEEQKNIDRSDIILHFTPGIKSGEDVLFVDHLKKSYDRLLFEKVNFNVYRKEKIGLIGRNGVGKSTLFKMIMHQILPDEGKITLGTNVHIGYFDQEQKNLSANKTVIDEIWDDYPRLSHFEIRSYLAKVNFVGDDIFKTMDELSGGEKARISLLKILLSEANFLLMDEPTNHLDIDSKEILEDALKEYEGTVLVISHDRYFLNKVCEKIIDLKSTGANIYLGNYDYYVEKIREEQWEDKNIVINKTQMQKDKKKKRENKKKRREQKEKIASMEQLIMEKEEEKENICKSINDNYRKDPEYNPSDAYKKLAHLEREIEALYDKWEILSLKE